MSRQPALPWMIPPAAREDSFGYARAPTRGPVPALRARGWAPLGEVTLGRERQTAQGRQWLGRRGVQVASRPPGQPSSSPGDRQARGQEGASAPHLLPGGSLPVAKLALRRPVPLVRAASPASAAAAVRGTEEPSGAMPAGGAAVAVQAVALQAATKRFPSQASRSVDSQGPATMEARAQGRERRLSARVPSGGTVRSVRR